MNRNIAKHRILEYFKAEMDKSGVKVPVIKIDYDTYCSSIKGLTPDEVSTYLIIMREEGYFTFDKVGEDNYEVQIKKKGLIEFADRKYIRKRNKHLFQDVKNMLLLGANLAVAIIAFFALTKKPTGLQEIHQLQTELKQLNSRLLKLEGKATPSNQHQLYNYQSTQKKFSKHSSIHF